MNALCRPGPLNTFPTLSPSKHGSEEEIELRSPDMEEYLAETMGLPFEQVMLLSQKLAGFTKVEPMSHGAV